MSTIKKTLRDTTWRSNPIAYQVLGICSALAVTVQLENSIVMTIAVLAVLCGSNVTISALRNYIPHRIRIIVEHRYRELEAQRDADADDAAQGAENSEQTEFFRREEAGKQR
jgi:phage shock protein PspC (stress-responsive transcriptional regulator)